MYSRKIKLINSKKKSKSTAPPGSSNWGPRIALAEKEKALSQSQYSEIKFGQELQACLRKQSVGSISGPKCQRQPPPFRGPLPPLPPPKPFLRPVPKKMSLASLSSHTESSSTGDSNYIYGYERKVSTSSGSCRSVSLSHLAPFPHSQSHYGYYQSSRRRNAYETSSSDIIRTPLTLIIPTLSEKPEDSDDFVLERDQDSVSSTQTYNSNNEEEENKNVDCENVKDNGESQHHESLGHFKDTSRSHEFQINSGDNFRNRHTAVLKQSTTETQLHHNSEDTPNSSGSPKTNKLERWKADLNATGPEDPVSSLDDNDAVRKSNSIGSNISFYAQGIYVPMEVHPKSKSAAILNAMLQDDTELCKLMDERENVCGGGEREEEPVKEKDPDEDSLLESFDSVMFQPKENFDGGSEISSSISFRRIMPSTQIEQTENCTRSTCKSNNNMKVETKNEVQHARTSPSVSLKYPSVKMIRAKLKLSDGMFANLMRKSSKSSTQSNSPVDRDTCVSQREASIKSAVEKLENMIRSSSSFSSTPSPPPQNLETIEVGTAEKESNGNDKENDTRRREEQLLLTLTHESDTEIDAYSSTFLSCGHVLKEDDYSTLSSTHDFPSSQSSPVASAAKNDNSEFNPSTHKGSNRSVIQQLTELSILIGGGERYSELDNAKQNSCECPATNDTPEGFRLHEDTPSRKVSATTENSADSGQGSASVFGSNSEISSSDSSPKKMQTNPDSLEESCDQNDKIDSTSCIFRPDCSECLMYNKPANGFSKPDASAELCGKSNSSVPQTTRTSTKRTGPSKIIRRKSSLLSKPSSSKLARNRGKKHLILEYCECNNCRNNASKIQQKCMKQESLGDGQNIRRLSNNGTSKLNRSFAFRNSSRPPLLNVANRIAPIDEIDGNSNGLSTIEEENLSMQGRSLNSVNRDTQRNVRGQTFGKTSHCWHSSSWLSPDPVTAGWSDLESLYSLNMKQDKPRDINGECWACWQEISEIKKKSVNPNATVDRTKRMFIWLNKRHKEFQAPWWEAKKQASIRWIMMKALSHVPKEHHIDPFKESKQYNPTRYRLKKEVIKGLVSGKLYGMALANIYRETLGQKNFPAQGLCHWEIIKILARRDVYVALPCDMKLTQGTLRQSPIKIAAHIALIEAIMSLYSKDILSKSRIIATLFTFGCTIKSETNSPEQLVIAWINAAVLAVKSYIMSISDNEMSTEMKTRFLKFPQMSKIRDLWDGIGILCLFAVYYSGDLKPVEIKVPQPGELLSIYDSINNHTLIRKLCEEQIPGYYFDVNDVIYIRACFKQNILCFLADLYNHFELNPSVKVSRLTHIPIRIIDCQHDVAKS